jgi:hypothetical protein
LKVHYFYFSVLELEKKKLLENRKERESGQLTQVSATKKYQSKCQRISFDKRNSIMVFFGLPIEMVDLGLKGFMNLG